MANRGGGFIRKVILSFDRTAARRMQEEAEEALEKAGKTGGEELAKELEKGGAKAARALATSLNQEYRKRIAAARRQLADETIDERQFREAGRKAAKEFNDSYSKGLRELSAKNKLTDLELTNATGRLKTVASDSAAAGAGLLSRFGGPLAGLFTVSAAVTAGADAVEKADALNASIRKLGGAARVTGTDLSFLQDVSGQVQEKFKLSIPFANELTGAMNKMAVRAGDANLLLPALGAWLDLAAANGLDAAQAMEALQTTIIGQDEGLNKLGLSNPQQIYEAWGRAAGVSAAKMTDAQKAQAILNAVTEAGSKVQGEYGKYLESNAGKADQNAQSIDTMKAKAGEALQPIRSLAGELKEGLYANLFAISLVLGKIITYAGKTFRFTMEVVTTPGVVWQRLWNGGADRGPVLSDTQGPEALAATIARINAGTAVDAAGNPYKSPAQRRAEQAAAAEKAEKERKNAADRAKKDAEQRAKNAAAAESARVKALWDNFDKFLHSQAGFDLATGAGLSQGPLNVPDIIRSAQAGVYQAAQGPTRGQTAFSALFGSTKEDFEADASEAAYNIASSFQDAFDLMRSEGATLGKFMEGVFRGMAGFALAGLASFAEAKANENFAAALEAAAYALGFTSHGNFASASAAWASAAQHAAAGVAWGALAGAAGSARGAATGGGGAIPTNVRSDPGLSTFDASQSRGQPVNVYVNPFDPDNPVQATQVGKAVDLHVHLARPRWAA